MGSETELRRLLLRQAGVVSRAQALDCGVSRRQIDGLLAGGDWLAVHPGVYRVHVVVPSPESSVRAASLWLGPQAVLTGPGAAWWWVCLPEPPSRLSFTSTSSSRGRRSSTLTVSRSFVDSADQTTHLGLAVLTRPLAVLQAAAALDRDRPGEGITLLDRAKQRHWASESELQRSYLRHRGTWGSREMRRLLDRTGDQAHSELERLAVRLLRAAGITGFVVNHRTVLPGGRPAELDIAFVDRRVALELDGWAYHRDPEAHRADVQRANEVMAAGWTLRRFTWSDVVGDPEGFVAAVREVLAL